MDITHLFKSGVMAVKLQRKVQQSKDEPLTPMLDKGRILPRKADKSVAPTVLRDEFSKQSKEVCHKITTLRNVLLENRTAYMRIGQHLKSSAHMTDEQRDLIDRESEKFFAYYTQHLGQMRSDWKRDKRKSKQRQEHIEGVLELLSNYLRNVQQIYLEQKKYRVQHELETYRLLKLAADKKKIPVRPAGEHSGKQRTLSVNSSVDNLEEHLTASSSGSDMDLHDGWQVEELQKHSSSPKTRRRRRQRTRNEQSTDTSTTSATASGSFNVTDSKSLTQKVAIDDDIQKTQQLVDEAEAEAASELSPEDVQVFEQENKQLYQELQGLSEEVEQIEKNVVDIAQLQDIFTEKVSLQQHNIERIANAVVGATENVKDANEQIKQAIQRNAGLRVWSLFFLLVMSFALLFLDWYYD